MGEREQIRTPQLYRKSQKRFEIFITKMSPRNTNSRRRLRGSKRAKTKSIASVSKVELRGRKIACPTHPPEFVPVPWYNLIVRISDLTDISASSLITSLRNQLNLGTANFIQVRIISIRIWGPLVNMNAAAHLSELRASFWSLLPANSVTTGGTFSIQEEVFDFPDQVRRAAVGYEYPIAQQQIVINQNSSMPVCHLVYGGGTGNLAYVRVLWRSSATVFADSASYDPDSDRFVYHE